MPTDASMTTTPERDTLIGAIIAGCPADTKLTEHDASFIASHLIEVYPQLGAESDVPTQGTTPKRFIAYGEGFSGEYDTWVEAKAVCRANKGGAVYERKIGSAVPAPPAQARPDDREALIAAIREATGTTQVHAEAPMDLDWEAMYRTIAEAVLASPDGWTRRPLTGAERREDTYMSTVSNRQLIWEYMRAAIEANAIPLRQRTKPHAEFNQTADELLRRLDARAPGTTMTVSEFWDYVGSTAYKIGTRECLNEILPLTIVPDPPSAASGEGVSGNE